DFTTAPTSVSVTALSGDTIDAKPERTIESNCVLRYVGKRNRNAITFFHTEPLECAGEADCITGELGIGELCPVVDEGCVAWVTARCAIESQISRRSCCRLVMPGFPFLAAFHASQEAEEKRIF